MADGAAGTGDGSIRGGGAVAVTARWGEFVKRVALFFAIPAVVFYGLATIARLITTKASEQLGVPLPVIPSAVPATGAVVLGCLVAAIGGFIVRPRLRSVRAANGDGTLTVGGTPWLGTDDSVAGGAAGGVAADTPVERQPKVAPSRAGGSHRAHG